MTNTTIMVVDGVTSNNNNSKVLDTKIDHKEATKMTDTISHSKQAILHLDLSRIKAFETTGIIRARKMLDIVINIRMDHQWTMDSIKVGMVNSNNIAGDNKATSRMVVGTEMGTVVSGVVDFDRR